MNLIFTILFAKAFGTKKVTTRITKRVKNESKFWIQVIIELSQLINKILRFVFIGMYTLYKKCFCQKTVDKINGISGCENIIDFNEYKLKKAK